MLKSIRCRRAGSAPPSNIVRAAPEPGGGHRSSQHLNLLGGSGNLPTEPGRSP
jgi:hypothetical protein